MTRRHVTFALAAAALLRLLGASAMAQPETAPASAPAGEGHALLAAIDLRLYSAWKHDIQDLSFRYTPSGEGVLAPDFRIRYTWKRPDLERITFEDLEGRVLEELPPRFRELRERFMLGARSLGAFFVGRPLAEAYRDYRIDVRRRMVNDREETRLVMFPKIRKRWARVEVTLDVNGLPGRWERFTDEEASFEQLHVHERRGEEWLLTGWTQRTTRDTSQETITYQKVRGYLLPREWSVAAVGGIEGRAVTVFDDVRVNEGIPAEFFRQ